MKAPFDRLRGVCMTFTYRLLGMDAELSISVEPRNMKKEQLWLVKNPQKDAVWKTGKVSLGIVTEFRVGIFSNAQGRNIFHRFNCNRSITPFLQCTNHSLFISVKGIKLQEFFQRKFSHGTRTQKLIKCI